MEAAWFYIGHYGQLGPLTREQMDELIEGGVITSETYVWKSGMSDWIPAERVPEFMSTFRRSGGSTPPPPPTPGTRVPAPMPQSAPAPYSQGMTNFSTVKSDKSRIAGGVLQIIPGVGRIYLGHTAIGVLQLVLSMCGGIGAIWSWIDGVIILSGGVKMDGYGRQLPD